MLGVFLISPLDSYAPLESAEDFLKIGERICNLEGHYNNAAGFDGDDDTLPRRFLEEGTGPASGQVCDLEKMKEEYYGLRGWNNGVVPDDKLEELEITHFE